jgi:hypothetical protein
MIRALTALIGFALAAVILYFVPDAGDVVSDPVWSVPLLWAAAGLVAGIFYQAGGLRRPGLRMNPWLFLLVFVPWTAVTVGLIAASTGDPSWLADRARSIAGQDAIDRWTASLAAFAFVSGLLLAFSVIEPRTAVVEEVVADRRYDDADTVRDEDRVVVPPRRVVDNETTTVGDPVDTR